MLRSPQQSLLHSLLHSHSLPHSVLSGMGNPGRQEETGWPVGATCIWAGWASWAVSAYRLGVLRLSVA
jgi:hypothetical protein